MFAIVRFLFGFVLGAIIGASVVLLTTPRSGQETQETIKQELEMLLEKGRQASDARKTELEARIQDMIAGRE